MQGNHKRVSLLEMFIEIKPCIYSQLQKKNLASKGWTNHIKQGLGAEDSVGPHSGRPVLLWPTMKLWIVCFHF